MLPSYYSTQYGLQYHAAFCVLQGALRIKTGIWFTRWTQIRFISCLPGDFCHFLSSLSTHAKDFHFKQSSANKQGLAPWAMVFVIIGVHIQFCTSYFIFVNFVPRLILLYIDSHPPGRFAAICGLITPNLIDEVLWPPASLVLQWNRGGAGRCEDHVPTLQSRYGLSQNHQKLTVCSWPVKCALTWSTGMTFRGFQRLINRKCNLTNALCCLFSTVA